MTALIDQVLALAARLNDARAEVARLEAELEGLLGGGSSQITRGTTPAQPGRRLRKEATTTLPERARPSGEPPVPPATGKAKRGERRAQIVALYKQGITDASAIAAKLGIARKVAGIAIWHARKDGDLPKAEKSR